MYEPMVESDKEHTPKWFTLYVYINFKKKGYLPESSTNLKFKENNSQQLLHLAT
jgi:hypothetical protein